MINKSVKFFQKHLVEILAGIVIFLFCGFVFQSCAETAIIEADNRAELVLFYLAGGGR